MASISAIKWFIRAKNLEFYEGLQQYNLSAVYCLNNWVALKPKTMTYFIGQAAHYLTFIGVLETPFKHHLIASKNVVSASKMITKLLRPVANFSSLPMEVVSMGI
jgi:hypothetical protein